MRIWSRKIKIKKSHKNRFGEGLGPLLGRGLGGLGRLLGALWSLLAGFWTFKNEHFFNVGPRWALRSLLDRSGIDLGRAWGGFWEDLGRD